MSHWSEDQYQEYMRKFNRDIKPFHLDTMETPDEGPESELQNKIVKWAHDKGYPCLALRQSKKAKYLLTAGWPDVTLCLNNGVALFIELKNGKGRLSDVQKQMAITMMYLKQNWHECRSFKKFLEIVGRYNA